MKQLLIIFSTFLISLTIISCKSSDDGSKSTDNTTTDNTTSSSELFVAVGDNGTILTSSDGTTWTTRTSGTTNGIDGVTSSE